MAIEWEHYMILYGRTIGKNYGKHMEKMNLLKFEWKNGGTGKTMRQLWKKTMAKLYGETSRIMGKLWEENMGHKRHIWTK